ncbi:MAG: hypothetical protein J0I08_24575 [Rhizobiales bacterium]|nr:hypothetical protein [Hyphomicrobiales bacterium]
MSIVKEVAVEILGMFLADATLTATTLVLVAIVAVLLRVLHVEPLVGGGLLLLGGLAILAGTAAREAFRRSAS